MVRGFGHRRRRRQNIEYKSEILRAIKSLVSSPGYGDPKVITVTVVDVLKCGRFRKRVGLIENE